MAQKTYKVTAPDKTVISVVDEEGIPKESIIAKAKQIYQSQKQAPQGPSFARGVELAPGVPVPGMPQAPLPPEMSRINAPKQQLGEAQGTFRAFGQGITAGQLAPMTGAASILNPFDEGSPTKDTGGSLTQQLQRWAAEKYLRNRNQVLEQEQQFSTENPWLQAGGELTGAAALTYLTGGASGEAAAEQTAAKAAARTDLGRALVSGATTGAAYGAASGFGRSKAVTAPEMSLDVLKSGALGAITGGILSPATQLGGNLISKYRNRGKVQLPEEITSAAKAELNAATQEASALTQQAEETATQAEKKAQEALDLAKLKTSKSKTLESKVQQREDRRLAFMTADAERQTAQANDLMQQSQDSLQGELYTTLGKLENEQAQTWGKVAKRTDDAIVSSLESANQQTKQQADQLYNQVSNLAAGEEKFPLTNLAQALGTRTRGKKVLPLNSADRFIGRLRTRILGEEEGEKTLRKYSFAEVQKAITELEGVISSGYAGEHGAIASQDIPRLQNIKNALERDAKAFLEGKPELQNAVDAANKFYKEVRVPFMNRDISEAFQKTDADQVFKALSGGNEDQARRVLSLLTPEGASGMRGKLLEKLKDEATDPQTGVLKPELLLKKLNEYQPQLKVYFEGATDELDKLKMLARDLGKSSAPLQTVPPPSTAAQFPRAVRAGQTVEARESRQAASTRNLNLAKELASTTKEEARKASNALTEKAKQSAEAQKETAKRLAEELAKKKVKARGAAAVASAIPILTGVLPRTGQGLIESAFLASAGMGAFEIPAVERFLLSESKYSQGALAKALRKYASSRAAKEFVTK